jgi:hypothetical protein
VFRPTVPSAADLLFIIVAPIKAIRGAVKLTQSDGDLAAHLRMGDTILSLRHIPAHSLASYTAASEPMVAHAWLSEIIFALLYRLGGLPLLAILTGIVIAATHGMVLIFLRRRGVDPRWALIAALMSLALSASHWLTRPHMFSILGAALTLFILESERPRRPVYFFVLFAIWANLHGGWLYGLLLIGAYIAGDLAEALTGNERETWIGRARADSLGLLAAVVGTFVNPYGIGLHHEVVAAVTSSSLANNIAEYLSPNFHDITNLAFLIAILLTVTLLAFTTRRMPFRWLFVMVMSLYFALSSFRNISLFGVTAWPLIALHVARGWPDAWRRFPFFNDFARIDRQAHSGWWSIPMALLLVALGVNHGNVGRTSLVADRFDAATFPVAAVDSAKHARLSGRTFTPWVWGGYLMYAWQGTPLHVDPLKFSKVTMDSYTRIAELRPGWQSELNRWSVQTVVVKTKSPLADALLNEHAWAIWYRDSTASIFRRPASRAGTVATAPRVNEAGGISAPSASSGYP